MAATTPFVLNEPHGKHLVVNEWRQQAMSPKPNTLLDAVAHSLGRAARYNPGDVVQPAAILWADEQKQWRPVVELLRPLMPALLEYGQYDPDNRKGPAIWLRSVIEPSVRKSAFSEIKWSHDVTPVIYLPGVGRQSLRAVEECPDELKPLVELQFRGAVWTQKNGRDWTLRAFLASRDGGLGLDIAEDRKTLEAIHNTLHGLAQTPLDTLWDKRLEAKDFYEIVEPDHLRALLSWLSHPGIEKMWAKEYWTTFCNRCLYEYDFDPQTDGELAGAQKLGLRQGLWQLVWDRFSESPGGYPGIPELLKRAKPNTLIFDKEPWPDENETQENELHNALLSLQGMNVEAARQKILDLETLHGARRDWIWAKLSQSPLATALEHLASLAGLVSAPFNGDSAEDFAKQYTEHDYLCDDAALQALGCTKSEPDQHAVVTAVRTLYLQWLHECAKGFQRIVSRHPLPDAHEHGPVVGEKGDCLVFVDGLRYDLGQRLAKMAQNKGFRANTAWRWAARPTVTATAKPASSPLVADLRGREPGTDFVLVTLDKGAPLTSDRFARLLKMKGFEVLEGFETGTPDLSEKLAWTECGQFDKMGHNFGWHLAEHVQNQLQAVLDRISNLLAAGWKRIQVVTDHGWLLVPGGLPKHDLPSYLVESKWPRFALVKDTNVLPMAAATWSWNTSHFFVYAPGISCYRAGFDYAHGGISLQECVIPIVTVQSTGASLLANVTICEISWLGMRCRLSVAPIGTELTADLRIKPKVINSSITRPKKIDSQGKASLVVEDDSLEGTIVSLVVTDSEGKIVCQQATVVGEGS